MFKNPFSFNGRIRRTEYGISYIIYIVTYVIASLIIEGSSGGAAGSAVGILIILPLLWFLLAQGAKRCHDLGRSGWWQIIPFYGLWMLFADGKPGRNEYGSNPKGPEELDVLDSETLDGHLRQNA